MKKILLFICISIILFLPNYARAHSNGNSLEKEVNDFVIDMGIDQQAILPGDPVVFDFNLLEKTTSNEVEFDSLWVTLKKENLTVFATGIAKAKLGKTTLLYTFPSSGEYTLSVRFLKDNLEISQTEFPLKVVEKLADPGIVEKYSLVLIGTLAGVLVGALIALWLKKANK